MTERRGWRAGLVLAQRPVALAAAAGALACSLAAGCSDPPRPPLELQRGLLTADNRTAHDWLDVEIWINRQYRVTVPKIAAGSRFSTTLDVFVAGFGQRFDRGRQRVDDLRLAARQPDGTRVEHVLAGR